MLEPMISYAQNREDVWLRRLFAEVSNGVYVDVGANHPVAGSVTRHFYGQGWRGVNVEPGQFYPLVVADRPADINLQCAISNHEGEITLYQFPEASGLSTCCAEEAAVHRDQLGLRCEEVTVPMTTLAQVCQQHVKNREINFMSVDVEGHEREVLEGADWSRFRPKVVMVEATRPNSPEPTHHRWEDLLLAADYQFAAFDGLNRYYVRHEDRQLAERLQVPINYFDNYTLYEVVDQKQKIHDLYEQVLDQVAKNTELYNRQVELVEQVNEYSQLGPQLLTVVRRVRAASVRYPRLTRNLKRILRRAA